MSRIWLLVASRCGNLVVATLGLWQSLRDCHKPERDRRWRTKASGPEQDRAAQSALLARPCGRLLRQPSRCSEKEKNSGGDNMGSSHNNSGGGNWASRHNNSGGGNWGTSRGSRNSNECNQQHWQRLVPVMVALETYVRHFPSPTRLSTPTPFSPIFPSPSPCPS